MEVKVKGRIIQMNTLMKSLTEFKKRNITMVHIHIIFF